MFTILKVIKPFFLPPTLIALGMLASLILILKKRTRAGKLILGATLAVYYLLSTLPAAYFLTRSLDQQYLAAPSPETGGAEAIVILAGGADQSGKDKPFAELSGISWRRLWRGLEIYRQLDKKMPIIYSGISGDPFDQYAGEPGLAKQYAVSMGIPQDDFWTEVEARTTAESGIYVRRMLDERFPKAAQHTIVLVTSATHLPRAVSVMERHNIKVLPIPADFRVTQPVFLSPLQWLPSIDAFSASLAALHEWIGRAGYWIVALGLKTGGI
ncbi:YdcF family protein [Candidatus Uhrbacteria bacterium]|nr:YdcF family protein [Candidatus Uhrbacteria bacterium]